MNDLLSFTSAQLKHAANLKDKIDKLEKKLRALLGSEAGEPAVTPRKRKMSAVGRAKIAVAQEARWAKAKGAAPADGKKKRKISAATKAKMAAAAKDRWAKAKAAGKTSL